MNNKFPHYMFIILASPPCQNYSICNTTGLVTGDTLAMSDELVALIKLLKDGLNSILSVIENPATGKLPHRNVITPWPYRYGFDYCRFGFLARKRTFFCDKDLGEYLYLPDDMPGGLGANSCLCLGDKGPVKCASMYNGNHSNWNKMTLEVRQSIPKQLSAHLAHAIVDFLNANVLEHIPQTRGSEDLGGRKVQKPKKYVPK
jgi:hypothetical protein